MLSNIPGGWDQTLLFPSEKTHGKKYRITITPLSFIQGSFIAPVLFPYSHVYSDNMTTVLITACRSKTAAASVVEKQAFLTES